jgi:hypothetical protein
VALIQLSIRPNEFSYPHHVQGRASIADLFPLGKRCGLYILHFSNGEIYAGQALDVTRRYIQHRAVHADIERISFRRVAKHALNAEERALIWSLEESGHRLRNITFTSIPKGESDFDLVMPVEEQDRWLKDPDYVDSSGSRVVDPELRRRYSRKFERFAAMSRSSEATYILRSYVRAGILAFRRDEVSFWCVSCMPECDVYARINIYWQEVLTVFLVENELRLSLHMADSPFTLLSDEAVALVFERHPTLGVIRNPVVYFQHERASTFGRTFRRTLDTRAVEGSLPWSARSCLARSSSYRLAIVFGRAA